MAKYTVTQVNGETSTGNHRDERRSQTVDASQVSATRDAMRQSMRSNPAESSDWVRVTPA